MVLQTGFEKYQNMLRVLQIIKANGCTGAKFSGNCNDPRNEKNDKDCGFCILKEEGLI